MVYYIFCSCLFIFGWLFIGFLFFLKSGCQNNCSLGINFDKIVISFLCSSKPPLPPDIENNSAMIEPEKEVVNYLWYGKLRLNVFFGIWNLDHLQNKHKWKEPNFPEFTNFISVQVRNQNFKRHQKVNQCFHFIFKRKACFDLFQHILFILIQSIQ